ncbi:Rv0623 family protein transcription factor [Granulicella mallensis MP5ACTX8]|uniref:Rv0623 family protein transcription factor n=2 Tax=Granulicella mallensis TaxID=940614 RepID=G8NNV7_GRAMM|nr:Rv0623 family protein transcription factor [Granulicella mallensis MP5ACTX8]
MYTMYMALHITNPAVEQKVRSLASVTGESITEAIGAAAEERLIRFNAAGKNLSSPSVEEVLAMIRSFNLKPINEDLTDDEILGYGPEGFCE